MRIRMICMACLLALASSLVKPNANATVASARAALPDLVVKEIVFEQSPSKIRVRVLNVGGAASTSCLLSLRLVGFNPPAGTKALLMNIPALEVGKGFSDVIDVSPGKQSDGQWQAIVDRTNIVSESNENNNTLIYPPGSAGPNRRLPDLVIDHFELTDPSKGQVKIEVANKGGGNSGPCTLRLIVWEAGKFEQKEAKTVFVKVQALHAVQTTTVIAVAGVPIINTKYSMFIDISHDVKETDENNNRAEGEAGNFKP